MPVFTEQLTEALAVADVINQAAVNNASINTSGIDMSKGGRAMWIIQAAGLGAAGTVDGRLQSSPNANFNVVHNMTGTNLTQIVTNNGLATIEVRADQVAQQNAGDRYVRCQLTGGANALTGITAIGLLACVKQHPEGYDLNTSQGLTQRVVCNS